MSGFPRLHGRILCRAFAAADAIDRLIAAASWRMRRREVETMREARDTINELASTLRVYSDKDLEKQKAKARKRRTIRARDMRQPPEGLRPEGAQGEARQSGDARSAAIAQPSPSPLPPKEPHHG